MIKLFDEETAPLTEYEENTLLPVMAYCLSKKVGKAMSVTNKYIVEKMKEHNYEITDARVRKLINHIRNHDLVPCLIATSAGYYIAETEKELIDYEESLYSRECAIANIRKAISRQRVERFGEHNLMPF